MNPYSLPQSVGVSAPRAGGLVIGWDEVERAGRGEMIVTPARLKGGFAVNIGGVRFRTSFKIINKLTSGRYLVEDPSVRGFSEWPMAEPEEKT
jgi:hypothetical protein